MDPLRSCVSYCCRLVFFLSHEKRQWFRRRSRHGSRRSRFGENWFQEFHVGDVVVGCVWCGRRKKGEVGVGVGGCGCGGGEVAGGGGGEEEEGRGGCGWVWVGVGVVVER